MRRIEAFVGINDEVMEVPTLVDILTQIVNLRKDADKIQSDAGLFPGLVDEHMIETLNTRETTKAQLESLHKDNENLCAEIVVLCRVVVAFS